MLPKKPERLTHNGLRLVKISSVKGFFEWLYRLGCLFVKVDNSYDWAKEEDYIRFKNQRR